MTTLFLQQTSPGGAMSLLPFVLILVVMYLFFFRPQMKKQKEENKFRAALEKGMKVVTTSGIHGKILEVDDKTVLLECENCRLRFERAAISKDMTAGVNPAVAKK
jgi:preprotein translocase subunit YajC